MKNKKKKKKKLTPEKLQKKLEIFDAKKKEFKRLELTKKQKKRQKKERKKHEKIMRLVKSEFQYKGGKEIVGFLAKSVAVNKTLLKRDAAALAVWRGEYYDILFNKIKALIVEHNERMEFEAEKLSDDIAIKQEKLDELRGEFITLGEQVEKLKAEKGILENA